MFYYEGKKIDEIAKKLDVSNSKIKVSLHRIRKKIKISLPSEFGALPLQQEKSLIAWQ